MRTLCWVTYRIVGFHRFPTAPNFVSYLKSKHRHEFHFKVGVGVMHDDREIEFHTLQARLVGLHGDHPVDFGDNSCEMIAKGVVGFLLDTYPGRYISVTVSEDGECGATVTTT
jgi:hypothetical protein